MVEIDIIAALVVRWIEIQINEEGGRVVREPGLRKGSESLQTEKQKSQFMITFSMTRLRLRRSFKLPKGKK